MTWSAAWRWWTACRMQWIIFTSMAASTQMSSSQKTVGVPICQCCCFSRPLKQKVTNVTVVMNPEAGFQALTVPYHSYSCSPLFYFTPADHQRWCFKHRMSYTRKVMSVGSVCRVRGLWLEDHSRDGVWLLSPRRI